MNMTALINIKFFFHEDNSENYENLHNLQLERLHICSKSIYEIPDVQFRKTFRLSKDVFNAIVHELTPHMKIAGRNDALSIETKIAAAIWFFAQGSYQHSIGNDLTIGMSQPSVSKSMKSVVACINKVLCPKYIKFPTTNAEKTPIKEWFRNQYGIINVIGVVDGTQIGIFPPCTQNVAFPEYIYVNRKGFHSINVQLIIDHNYKILALNAKFPGCTHDSHIWRMSMARQHLSTIYRDNHEWILGDSGYPLEPWILTPFAACATEEEEKFNDAHKRARSVVKRAIGVLKGCWCCLCKQGMLHYSPSTCSKIVNACAALHNICITNGDILPMEEIDLDEQDNEVVHFGANNALYQAGNANCQQIMWYIVQNL